MLLIIQVLDAGAVKRKSRVSADGTTGSKAQVKKKCDNTG